MFCGGLIGVYIEMVLLRTQVYLPVFSHLTCILRPPQNLLLKVPSSPVFSHLPRISLLTIKILFNAIVIAAHEQQFVVISPGLNNRIKSTCASITIGIKWARTVIFYLLQDGPLIGLTWVFCRMWITLPNCELRNLIKLISKTIRTTP